MTREMLKVGALTALIVVLNNSSEWEIYEMTYFYFFE